MKTRLTKTIALVLSALMIVLCFAGCGASKTAISFGSTEFTANMFNYWMSTYKAVFLYSMLGSTTDNPQLWSMQISQGITYGDYLGAMAATDIMSKAVCHELFGEYNLELTAEELAAIDERIANLESSVGSKAALNSALSAFGVNKDILREINIIDAKVSKLQQYLYGEGGPEAPTEAELDEYYKSSYYRAKYIFISTQFDYEYDENGEVILDEEQGAYKTRELTPVEITERKELALDLEKRVNDGEDFDKLVTEYTMDLGLKEYEEGYYFTSASTYVPAEVISTATALKVDEIKTVTNDNGTFIIKRYELEDGAYENEDLKPLMFSNMASQVSTVKLQALVSSYSESIVIDSNVVKQYPLATVSPNFYY